MKNTNPQAKPRLNLALPFIAFAPSSLFELFPLAQLADGLPGR
jgi:hypothetical protein